MKLKRKYSLKEISLAHNCSVIGDDKIKIDSVCSLSMAHSSSLSYLSDAKNIEDVIHPHMSNLITTEEISRLIYDRIASSPDSNLNISCIIHSNPQLIFIKLINASLDLSSSSLFSSKSSLLEMPESTLVGRNVVIGSNVVFGKNITIYPNVTICDESIIGDNVVIHSGAVIGSDGFGLVKEDDKWIKVPHIGRVAIGDNVEIGANTTIDRGTIDSTVIQNNVKIDNQVHIAHNVFIGENTAIAACVGIAGSTKIGKNCTIGGGSGINGHITITDNVHIHGMTMVTKSITEQGIYASGTTVEPVASWRKNQARFKELDSLAKTIKKKT